MADPGDADFAFANLWEMRADAVTSTLGKKRGNQNGGEEVALVPVGARSQLDAGRALVRRAVLRGLANDV